MSRDFIIESHDKVVLPGGEGERLHSKIILHNKCHGPNKIIILLYINQCYDLNLIALVSMDLDKVDISFNE